MMKAIRSDTGCKNDAVDDSFEVDAALQKGCCTGWALHRPSLFSLPICLHHAALTMIRAAVMLCGKLACLHSDVCSTMQCFTQRCPRRYWYCLWAIGQLHTFQVLPKVLSMLCRAVLDCAGCEDGYWLQAGSAVCHVHSSSC